MPEPKFKRKAMNDVAIKCVKNFSELATDEEMLILVRHLSREVEKQLQKLLLDDDASSHARG